MCPNCNRGLVKGELCDLCKGTGIYNPKQEVTTPKIEVSEPIETSPKEVKKGKKIAL